VTALDTGSEDLLAEVDALERPRSEVWALCRSADRKYAAAQQY
jgi:hypothetical protein